MIETCRHPCLPMSTFNHKVNKKVPEKLIKQSSTDDDASGDWQSCQVEHVKFLES